MDSTVALSGRVTRSPLLGEPPDARSRRTIIGALWLAAQLVVTDARGDHRQQADEEADRTFQEGRTLLANGAVEQACSAFAKSYELRPRHGTLLNLAVCLEKQAELVAAFHRFGEALAAAVSDGRGDRELLARTHLEALRKRLGWLSIELEFERNLPELQVSCDGAPQDMEASQVIALKPGPHVVKVTARGKVPFEATVEAVAGAHETLVVPPLAEAEGAAPDQPEVVKALPATKQSTIVKPAIRTTPRRTPKVPVKAVVVEQAQSWRYPLSISLLATGTAAFSVGVFCGVRALVDSRAVERTCVDRRCTTDASWSTGQRLEDRAQAEARIANVALPLGALALGASAYLLWTKPRPSRSTPGSVGRVQLAPTASVHSLGTSLRGTW